MRNLSAGEHETLESIVDNCGLQKVMEAFGTICRDKAVIEETVTSVGAKDARMSRLWDAMAFQLNRLGREAKRKGV